MKWTMVKAWLLGASVLIAAHVLWWGVAAGISHADALRNVLFIVPVAAAFLVSYLSPRHKLLLGVSMGPLGAALGLASMFMYRALGYHVDEIGGAIATFGILLGVHLAYAVGGTVLGYFAWRLRSNPRKAEF